MMSPDVLGVRIYDYVGGKYRFEEGNEGFVEYTKEETHDDEDAAAENFEFSTCAVTDVRQHFEVLARSSFQGYNTSTP